MENTKKWTMATGDKIRIKDMADSHLSNTLKMLERTAKNRYAQAVEAMLSCPGFSGEMAQEAFEDAERELLDGSWEDFVIDIYWDMWYEAIRRGLPSPQYQEEKK